MRGREVRNGGGALFLRFGEWEIRGWGRLVRATGGEELVRLDYAAGKGVEAVVGWCGARW